MKIQLIFAWYDLWIGLFWNKDKNWLYILPFPTIGIILKFPQRRYLLMSKYGNYPVGSCSYDKEELKHCMSQDNVYGKIYWVKNGTIEPIFLKDI